MRIRSWRQGFGLLVLVTTLVAAAGYIGGALLIAPDSGPLAALVGAAVGLCLGGALWNTGRERDVVLRAFELEEALRAAPPPQRVTRRANPPSRRRGKGGRR